MLANVKLGQDLKLLAQHGRVVVIGSRGDVTISPRDLMTRQGSIYAFTLWGHFQTLFQFKDRQRTACDSFRDADC